MAAFSVPDHRPLRWKAIQKCAPSRIVMVYPRTKPQAPFIVVVGYSQRDASWANGPGCVSLCQDSMMISVRHSSTDWKNRTWTNLQAGEPKAIVDFQSFEARWRELWCCFYQKQTYTGFLLPKGCSVVRHQVRLHTDAKQGWRMRQAKFKEIRKGCSLNAFSNFLDLGLMRPRESQ